MTTSLWLWKTDACLVIAIFFAFGYWLQVVVVTNWLLTGEPLSITTWFHRDATCLQTITSLWRNCRYIFKNDFDLQCFCSRLFAQFYINMHLKVHPRLYCNYQRPRQWLPSHDTALVSKGNEHLLLYVWVVYFIKKHSFFHTTTYALYQN